METSSVENDGGAFGYANKYNAIINGNSEKDGPSIQEKKNSSVEALNINGERGGKLQIEGELRDYIMADLIQQEKEGKINSANAVFKTLTQEDVEVYKRKFERELKKKFKIIVLPGRLLNENSRNLDNVYIHGDKAYILKSAKKAEQIYEKYKKIAELRDFDEGWEKYFPNWRTQMKYLSSEPKTSRRSKQ